mmetsp:Transcript_117146/g.343172  ORF Transcript_117146/g.343172 Transcript_117146/m.343172 type:complete len:218 (-) Transcript_117146:1586-2239(-)
MPSISGNSSWILSRSMMLEILVSPVSMRVRSSSMPSRPVVCATRSEMVYLTRSGIGRLMMSKAAELARATADGASAAAASSVGAASGVTTAGPATTRRSILCSTLYARASPCGSGIFRKRSSASFADCVAYSTLFFCRWRLAFSRSVDASPRGSLALLKSSSASLASRTASSCWPLETYARARTKRAKAKSSPSFSLRESATASFATDSDLDLPRPS